VHQQTIIVGGHAVVALLLGRSPRTRTFRRSRKRELEFHS
jgi:hypothetical protein